MTGDENADVWEGIEFEVHEPKDNMEVPIIDHIFQHSDGYQSDSISEYMDEIQPKDMYLTVPVPEQWINVMNSPAISVVSVDLNSPVLPFDLDGSINGINNFVQQNHEGNPPELANYSFDDFVGFQSWYQPSVQDSGIDDHSGQSFASNHIPDNGLGLFDGTSAQDSSQFDLERLGFDRSRSGSIDPLEEQHQQLSATAFGLGIEPVSPSSSQEHERRKSRSQNLLPDGRFWNQIKSNGSVLFACPWEGCGKSNLSSSSFHSPV
jgi:hypothetical protein